MPDKNSNWEAFFERTKENSLQLRPATHDLYLPKTKEVSVTRFGEISSLCQNVLNYLVVFLSVYLEFSKKIHILPRLHCCKWPFDRAIRSHCTWITFIDSSCYDVGDDRQKSNIEKGIFCARMKVLPSIYKIIFSIFKLDFGARLKIKAIRRKILHSGVDVTNFFLEEI